MGRLEEIISDIDYILDALISLRNIVKNGSCNDCKKKKDC